MKEKAEKLEALTDLDRKYRQILKNKCLKAVDNIISKESVISPEIIKFAMQDYNIDLEDGRIKNLMEHIKNIIL
jgi:hypothetical protein